MRRPQRRARTAARTGLLAAACATILAAPARAQEQEGGTRTAIIEQAQAEKEATLRPHAPGKLEHYLNYAESLLLSGGLHWHPFFTSAYSGGGFTLGGGYITHLGSYNILDVRGSLTLTGYKRIEAQFIAPRLLGRRATFSALGGWREATQVGFYGIGTASTSVDDKASYGFKQPYGSAALEVWPTRRLLVMRGGVELSRWEQTPGGGSAPSVEEIYTPATLPGLGVSATYLHSEGTLGLDSRTSPGYSRRGGFYGVTLHDFADQDERNGFTQYDYEAIQHVPLLREAWVLSFRGLMSTTALKGNQEIPFFMLPALGGGSSLRGFSSWRFRDRNSLLLQAEWRVMVNRFLDTALFYDAGKVTSSHRDLDLEGLKSDFGFGVRFHGPLATPLRIELAKSNEGFAIVFGASAAF